MNASGWHRYGKIIGSPSFHAIVSAALLAAATSPLWAQSDRDLFSRLDTDGDGKLTQTELPQGQRPNFARIDSNSDGAVSREELNAFRQRTNEADTPRQPRGTPTRPTHANVSYGPHKRNVLDLYLAESDKATPLVLYIHGGGFRGGDKNSLSTTAVQSFREAGWSIAAINYRLTDTAPAPAQYLDCARALQFLRHNAKSWNIDPRRVASTGGSAGAGTSMWLAFHDDLADSNSEDPVARQSTRLTCVAVSNGQSSYDPRFAERIGIPRPNFERHDFFKPFYDLEDGQFDTPEAYRRYDAAAPITYLTKDDPPVLMQYSYANEDVTPDTPLGLIVHHPKFGVALKDEMDKLGIECLVQYRDLKTKRQVTHGGGDSVSVVQFLGKHFAAASAEK